ncbi:MAG: hypothetical protein ACOCV2_13210, partial [Persicimonas sp.]
MMNGCKIGLFERRTMLAALVAGLLAIPAVGVAQNYDSERDVEEWKQCLDGQEPSTQNVEPWSTDMSADEAMKPGSEAAILDTDPERDQIVIDFDDGLSDETIEEFGEENGLDLDLNSIYSAESNVYVATVEEGVVPYVKDCLESKAPSGYIESAEENIEYALLGSAVDGGVDDEAGAGKAPDDPLYQFQWNFDQVGATDAWSNSTGKGVTVAVIDTGVAMENAPERNITRPK